MAYTKRVWDCGDKITAEALNHMEQGIEDAQDKGYECNASTTLLTEETVTTEYDGEESNYAQLSYSDLITADTIRVTFDGTPYICNKKTNSLDRTYYGSDDNSFSEYPFALSSWMFEEIWTVYNGLVTETAGSHTIKIETYSESIETSECFEKAVKSVVEVGYSCGEGEVTLLDEDINLGGDFNTDELSYRRPITEDYIIVYWDGDRYDCNKVYVDTGNSTYIGYGGINSSGSYNFNAYPFAISSYESGENLVAGNSSGTSEHNIKVKVIGEAVTTSDCFVKAVQEASGLKCGTRATLLTEEVVIAEDDDMGNYAADLHYGRRIDADTIRVTVDGVEYICPRQDVVDDFQIAYYGGFDDYPFGIRSLYSSDELINQIFFNDQGQYSVKVEALEPYTELNDCAMSIIGYACKREILFNQDVKFEQTGSSDPSASIHLLDIYDSDKGGLIVTFNGTEYQCEAIYNEGQSYEFGDSWYEEYPFYMVIPLESPYEATIRTGFADTYSVKIEVEDIDISPCFANVLNKYTSPLRIGVLSQTSRKITYDKTWEQVRQAVWDGRSVFLHEDPGKLYTVANVNYGNGEFHVWFNGMEDGLDADAPDGLLYYAMPA